MVGLAQIQRVRARVFAAFARLERSLVQFFRERDPTFFNAVTPALIVCAAIYLRSPASNYIFDEQEALLANPYVNGDKYGFFEAFKRDFWGLGPERSIGSYRPIPNMIWRSLWAISSHPWLHHWANVLLHSLAAALIASIAWRWTRSRTTGWMVGACFISSAILTETVCGVVGIADILGGLAVLLALRALQTRLWLMPILVLAATLFGLFSKESCIVMVAVLPWAALLTAPALHGRPLRALRAGLCLLATLLALILYVELRKRWFPVALDTELSEPLGADASVLQRLLHEFLRWFAQPTLPRDPINNPLVGVPFDRRLAGALEVYVAGLGQVLLPISLSGDYSFAQQLAPEQPWTLGAVAGGVFLFLAPIAGLSYWIYRLVRQRRYPQTRMDAPLLLALALIWVPASYFPHSNIAVLLPTIRAERFWYVPVIATSFVLAPALLGLYRQLSVHGLRRTAVVCLGLYFGFQTIQARRHAFDYSDDLAFWRATARSSPRSAKAHLNYGIMLGARDNLSERLHENHVALRLAPQWPMAHVYYADTLCRMKRLDEAWKHYRRGFELGPNEQTLIALGLQCMWDAGAIAPHEDELIRLADEHSGSWLAYFAREIVERGEEHQGIEERYRPRGYNQGPKDDRASKD